MGKAEKRGMLSATDRVKPVPRVEPPGDPVTMLGTARQLVTDEELIKPLYDDWEPDAPE